MAAQRAFRPAPETVSSPLINSAAADHMVLLREPDSPVTESYRTLRAKLQGPLSRGLQGLCLVSAWGRDGKSTVALNLAHSLSQLFHDVVLVDCDLRKPTLTRVFGLEGQPGISDLLTEGGDPTLALHPTPAERLQFLPAGTRLDNPADLLQRGGLLSECFDRLRAQQRIVVVDTSPVEACSDALLLGSTMGAALMVVSASQWEGEAEQRLKKSLLEHGFEVLGVVLNGVHPSGARQPYGYGKPRRKSFWSRFARPRRD